MNKVFNIQVQRVDNGFVAIAQNDTSGIKTKKVVAMDEASVKLVVNEFVEHMFDEPPPKPEKEVKDATTTGPTTN